MILSISYYRLPFLLLILSVIQVVGIAAESESGSNTAAAIDRDRGNADILYVNLVEGFRGRKVTVDLNKSRVDDFVVIKTRIFFGVSGSRNIRKQIMLYAQLIPPPY